MSCKIQNKVDNIGESEKKIYLLFLVGVKESISLTPNLLPITNELVSKNEISLFKNLLI
ncbi:MAG TPA: hypothetical protein VJ697_11205 [Nitrososphaeraceae archaeon]|nr:hypothetical protein [Nitrososphaeraceae archaeon]